jgi:hypothetical protein
MGTETTMTILSVLGIATGFVLARRFAALNRNAEITQALDKLDRLGKHTQEHCEVIEALQAEFKVLAGIVNRNATSSQQMLARVNAMESGQTPRSHGDIFSSN